MASHHEKRKLRPEEVDDRTRNEYQKLFLLLEYQKLLKRRGRKLPQHEQDLVNQSKRLIVELRQAMRACAGNPR